MQLSPFFQLYIALLFFAAANAMPVIDDGPPSKTTRADIDLSNPPQQERTLAGLPNEMLGKIAKHLDSIQEVASLKSVNKHLNKSLEVPAVPRGCQGLANWFNIDETTRRAKFVPNFLTKYLESLLPNNATIDDLFSDEYMDVVQGLRDVWDCVNALSRDGYERTAFSTEEISKFDQLGTERSYECGEMAGHPTIILISQIVNEEDPHDTSLALNLLRSGVIPEVAMMQLTWTLMPTLRIFYGTHEIPFYEDHVRGGFEILQINDRGDFESELIDRDFFLVANQTEMDSKTHELVNAFKEGVERFVASHDDENDNSVAVSLLQILSYALQTAFSADNANFLKAIREREFLQQFGRSVRRPMISGYSLLIQHLGLRIWSGEYDDKILLGIIKNYFHSIHPSMNVAVFSDVTAFRQRFPQIAAWYETMM